MNAIPMLIVWWIVFLLLLDLPHAKKLSRSNRWAAAGLTLMSLGVILYVWRVQIWLSPAHIILHWLEPISPITSSQ